MYDIERFKREKLSVNFKTKEEYKAFIQCCIDNEVKINDKNWWLNRSDFTDAVVYGFTGTNRLLHGPDSYHVQHGWVLLRVLLRARQRVHQRDLQQALRWCRKLRRREP